MHACRTPVMDRVSAGHGAPVLPSVRTLAEWRVTGAAFSVCLLDRRRESGRNNKRERRVTRDGREAGSTKRLLHQQFGISATSSHTHISLLIVLPREADRGREKVMQKKRQDKE